MKNLNKYSGLANFNESVIGIDLTYVYANGIAKKFLYDEFGDVLESNGTPVIATVKNFDTKITKILNIQDDMITIYWQGNFDYIGLAAIGDEIVYITGTNGYQTKDNLILNVKRAINNTVRSSYPENSIIRSVVNVTSFVDNFSFETRAEASSANMFSPVLDSSRILLDDYIGNWANYSQDGEFELRLKNVFYLFNGSQNEVLCDYIGFLDKFSLRTFDQKIDIMLKDKMSVVWNEEIKYNKTYSGTTIKQVLADLLNIPDNMIIYPLSKSNGLKYDEILKMHYWDGSLYSDDDFFRCSTVSTKDFKTYTDFIQSLCREMMCRIKFDTYERLVIQSDVFISNNDLIYDHDANIHHLLTEENDIINIEQTTENQLIVNKISGQFIDRETYYDNEDFLLKHTVFTTYAEFVSSDLFISVEEHLRTQETPKVEGATIQVVTILRDENYNNKNTWYRWVVSPSSSKRTDGYFGEVDSITWNWKFKGYADSFKTSTSDYEFTESVKYSKNKRIENACIMTLDPNDENEFTLLRRLQASDNNADGSLKDGTHYSIKIPIGRDINNVTPGDYVMLTDGIHDFMGMISEVIFGNDIISTKGNYVFTTNESENSIQNFRIINVEADTLYDIATDTGYISSYDYNKDTGVISGVVQGGSPSQTLSIDHFEKVIVESNTQYSSNRNVDIVHNGLKYSGVTKVTHIEYIYEEWEIVKGEYRYQQNSNQPQKIGAIIVSRKNNDLDPYEYRTVVSRSEALSTGKYNIYVKEEKRLVNKELSYTGRLYHRKYQYTIHAYTQKIDEQLGLENESSIVIVMGYDKDYKLNYWGRHDYLLEYANKPFDAQLFYVRNEFPYVWEYNRSDSTSTMEFPLIPGEYREVSGTFGGINEAERKFAGLVDKVNCIFGHHFSPLDADDGLMLYSREYHESNNIYVRSNKMNTIGKDKINYSTFDNSEFYLKIYQNNDFSESLYNGDLHFSGIDEFQTNNSSGGDFTAVFGHYKFYGQKIIVTNDTYAYRIDSSGNVIKLKIERLSKYTLLDWKIDDLKQYRFDKEFKIQAQNEYGQSYEYYIRRTACEFDHEKIEPLMVYGKKAIKVSTTKHPWNVGDLITLDKWNESKDNPDAINTKLIYSKYSDARWLVTSIDYNKDSMEAILYLDYEFPMGYNNVIPTINRFSSTQIVVLQEFGIKGNPYTEEVININYEHSTSVDIYGEMPYDGVTGKFLDKSDLNKALGYVINGFAGTSLDNTKFVIPLDILPIHGVEVFDLVKLDEKIYTGFNNQTCIILGKKIEYNNSETTCIYTVLTLGKYKITGDLNISESNNYKPIKLPNYNHSGNEGFEEDNIDLNDVSISKFDKTLGSVMLTQISSNNLSAKIRSSVSDENIIYIDNISSYYDNSDMLTKKRKYTKMLLSYGESIFLRINGEFVYCQVIDSINTTQSYTDKNTGEIQYVSDIAESATLYMKNRSVFDTQKMSMQVGDKVEFYQIASMTNQDGSMTKAIIIGSKNIREYLSFDVERGLDITSSQGRMLVGTNDDWYLQARNSLRGIYSDEYISVLTEDDIVDAVGNAVVQIGKSSDYDVDQWMTLTEYNAGDKVQYDNYIYLCEKKHTSVLDFNSYSFYWRKLYKIDLHSQFLRYTPLGGLEIKGNINIDSGSILINDISRSNNFLHLTESEGYIGIGTNGFVKVNPYDNGSNSYFQIGQYGSDSIVFSEDLDGSSSLEISTKSFSSKIGDSHIIELNKDKVDFILGQERSDIIFQIGQFNNSFLNSSRSHIRYTDKDGRSNLSMKVDNGYIGNNESYIYFDDVIDRSVDVLMTFSDSIARDNYFGTFDTITNKINGGTENGKQEFSKIIYDSYNGKYTYIITNGTIENYSYYDKKWISSKQSQKSMLSLNNGSQQIGNNVLDTGVFNANSGYSGFFFGRSNDLGYGDLASGKYLKYDGNNFYLGKDVRLYSGTSSISFDNIFDKVDSSTNLGTTVLSDNKITLFSSSGNKYSQVKHPIANIPITISLNAGDNIANISYIYPSIDNFSIIQNLYKNCMIKFVNSQNRGIEIETAVISIRNGYFEFEKVIEETGDYYLYTINNNSILAQIGDLKRSPNVGEVIRLGHGVSSYREAKKLGLRGYGSGEYSGSLYGETEEEFSYTTGLYLTSTKNNNYFKYDDTFGLSILSDNGVIDITTSKNKIINNKLYFDENESFISMNTGKVQIGNLFNINSSSGGFDLSLLNGDIGLFLGDSSSYFSYSEKTGINIKTLGDVSFKNSKNSLHFDKDGLDSHIRMLDNRVQVGILESTIEKFNDTEGMFIGDGNSYLGYNSSGLEIKGKLTLQNGDDVSDSLSKIEVDIDGIKGIISGGQEFPALDAVLEKLAYLEIDVDNIIAGLKHEFEDIDGRIYQKFAGIDISIDGIKQNVGQIRQGGDNLIYNSGNFYSLEHWTGSNLSLVDINGIQNIQISGDGITHNREYLLFSNTEYMYSCEIRSNSILNITKDLPLAFYCGYQKGQSTTIKEAVESYELIQTDASTTDGKWAKIHIKIKTKSTDNPIYFKPMLKSLGATNITTLKNIQIREGNIVSEWSPGIEGGFSYVGSVIEQTKNDISLKVDSIVVPGDNIIENSGEFKETTGWISLSQITIDSGCLVISM